MATVQSQESVHPEPKLFVGQVPADTTEPAMRALFEPHGAIKALSVPRNGNTNQSRRFAMVTFEKWAAAERAVQATHQSKALGGDNPLVVRFADPPKPAAGSGEVIKGIAPKKLFVGQVRLYNLLYACARIWASHAPVDRQGGML
jgi:RNA recognition motif-containing protein